MDLVVVYLTANEAEIATSIVSGASLNGLTAISTLQKHTLYWENFAAKCVLLIQPIDERLGFNHVSLRGFLRSQVAHKIFYAPQSLASSIDKTSYYFLGCDMVFDEATSIIELIARIEARVAGDLFSLSRDTIYNPKDRTIDYSKGKIEFTLKENLVFKLLVSSRGYVGSQSIQQLIAGQSGAEITSTAVTVHSLRKKLSCLYPEVEIVSRGGLGYRLKSPGK